MSTTFSSLSYPNYRLWFAGAIVANIGTWMQRVAQDWLVLTELTNDSGVAVGITTALQFGPALLLSAYAGVLADRIDRRRLLLATNGALGLLAAGLGLLVMSGQVQLWHVYLFAFGLGCVSALDGPPRQTFVADMVPPERLSNAVGLNSASFNAARLIGPGLAGVLIAAVGSGWVFLINGATFLATIAALLAMNMSAMQPRVTVPRARGQFRAGLAYVRNRTDLLVIMAVVGVISTFGLNFQLTMATMARTVFDKGAGEYGMLGSVMAIGSLAGALMAARRERPRVRLVIGSALAFGAATGLMALAPSLLTFALASIPVGFAALTLLTGANAAIQTSTEPVMRGRVMSIYIMVLLGATPIGAPFVGWVGEQWGARWSLGIGAITALLVAGAAAVWVMRNWDLELRYTMRSRPHLQVVYPDRAAEAAAEAHRARREAEERLESDRATEQAQVG